MKNTQGNDAFPFPQRIEAQPLPHPPPFPPPDGGEGRGGVRSGGASSGKKYRVGSRGGGEQGRRGAGAAGRSNRAGGQGENTLSGYCISHLRFDNK